MTNLNFPSTSFYGILLLLACALLPSSELAAQRRFGAGLIAGLTASQIDGDASAGYNKLGLQAGIRATALLGKRTEGSIEFLFAQRGAQTELVKDQFNPYNFSLTLNYVEVPVQFHYKDWLVGDAGESDSYHKVSVNGGLSYARLIGDKLNDELNGYQILVPAYLKKNDVSFLLGATFMFNRHVGITARYVRSLVFLYDPRDWNPAPYSRGWSPHSLYFQLGYMF